MTLKNPKINYRQRVRDVLKAATTPAGAFRSLRIEDVMSLYMDQFGEAYTSLSSVLSKLKSHGEVVGPHGFFQWNGKAARPIQRIRNTLIDALPADKPAIPNEPYSMSTARVAAEVRIRHKVAVTEKLVAALAAANWIPHTGKKKFKYPPRVVGIVADMGRLAERPPVNLPTSLSNATRKDPKRAPRTLHG